MFKDVDVCLFTHVAANFGVSWGRRSIRTAWSAIEYMFKGESAHAAGAPWRGKSALDAVELMDVGWNFRREHLRLAQRSHYVITNGGDQPNVVPPNAAVWYYFREADYDHIMDMWRIGDNMAKAATLMTDTTFTSRLLGSAWPGHFNRPIAEAMYENIKKVGLPQWSEDDQTMAKGLQKELKQPCAACPTKVAEMRAPRVETPLRRRRWPWTSDPPAAAATISATSVECAHRDAALPVQHPRRPRTQLGQRNRHGHADRAQRRSGRRQGAGHDHARYPGAP